MTTTRGEDSDPGASLEQHPFSVARRGFDQEEVRAFLRKVGEEVRAAEQRAEQLDQANEHLEAQLAQLREQIEASPWGSEGEGRQLDEATVVAAVGEEMAGLLRSAQSAAQDLRSKAAAEADQLLDSARSRAYLQESQAQRALAEATAEAERLRSESQTEADDLLSGARSLSERLRSEAEAEAERLRSESQAEADRLLSDARFEAERLRSESQAEADRLLSDARFESDRLRSDAKAEADRVRAEATGQAQREADELLANARNEAAAIADDAERERRLTVDGAQVARERILSDLARRRRIATVQIEQLRAGRERLLVSYGVVRRTLEEVHEEFQRADAEARAAAEEAGRRMAERLGADDPLEADDPLDADLDVGAGDANLDEPELAEELVVDEDAAIAVGEPAVEGDPDAGSAVAPGGVAAGDVPGGAGPEPPVSLTGEVAAPDADGTTFFGGQPPAPGGPGPGGVMPGPTGSLGSAGAAGAGAEPPRFYAGGAVASQTTTIVTASGEPSADLIVVAEPDLVAGVEAVNGLFERIRSGEESSVAEARRLMDGPAPTGAGLIPITEPGEQAEDVADAGEAEALGGSPDEVLLARRAEALEEIEREASRRLKRTLQDEQNDLFDRLRTASRPYGATALLVDADEHRSRYATVARSFLEEAADRGAEMAASLLPGATKARVDVAAAADVLASEIVVPLRRRLGAVIDEQREEDYEDIAEAVGSTYRETKTRRIEDVTSDQVAACFALGLWSALPAGTPVRWIAGKSPKRHGGASAASGVPCGDCDDNTLAGTLISGEPFPTGQPHPPAHDGCHCLVVPDVAS